MNEYVYIHCEIQGRSHISNNIECQDKTFSKVTNTFSAISLADGAGSAKYSHIGAECVTKEIINLIEKQFDSYYENNTTEIIKEDIIKVLVEKLQDIANNNKNTNTKNDINQILHNIKTTLDEYAKFDIDEIINLMQNIDAMIENIESKKKSFQNRTDIISKIFNYDIKDNELKARQDELKKEINKSINDIKQLTLLDMKLLNVYNIQKHSNEIINLIDNNFGKELLSKIHTIKTANKNDSLQETKQDYTKHIKNRITDILGNIERFSKGCERIKKN